MAIPDFQTLMLPLLRHVSRGRARTPEILAALASDFGLSDEEQGAFLPSGRQTVIANRVNWAASYLNAARLIERVARGTYEITDRGRLILETPPERISIQFLQQFPEFLALRPNEAGRGSGSGNGTASPVDVTRPTPAPPVSATPDEQIDSAIAATERALRDELLQRVLASTPRHFEDLVLDLMGKMGYGDTAAGARERLGGSGDGGVDGIIREDRLGLDVIYLQAKRYTDAAINAEQLRAFAGALADKGARKGVFLTTSRFTRDAEDYAKRQQQTRIVLIDGDRLTDLMLRYEVGVRAERTIVLKKIDTDYFDPDDSL